MVMNKGIPAGFIEATQLTRQGRLLEATALIQRVLGGGSAPAEADRRTPGQTGAHQVPAFYHWRSSEVVS